MLPAATAYVTGGSWACRTRGPAQARRQQNRRRRGRCFETPLAAGSRNAGPGALQVPGALGRGLSRAPSPGGDGKADPELRRFSI